MANSAEKAPDFWRLWLAIAVTGVIIVFFGWVVVQQALRQSANDPQWQLAHDAATRLNAGAMPADVIPADRVDETASLAPFVTVTDRQLKVLASSGVAGGQVPLPPAGSFTAALGPGNHWFSWQHNGGVRDAAVIIPYGGDHPGYVLAARSLQQVEWREAQIQNIALFTLLLVAFVPAVILLAV